MRQPENHLGHRAMTGLLLLGLLVGAAQAGDIVGWRTDGTGRYPGARPPIQWSQDTNVVWATPMMSWSNSTPVIVGKKLFVCSEPTSLLCLSVSDGKILWKHDNGVKQVDSGMNEPLPKSHSDNGYSTPTPVTDGKYVYALFGNGVVASYDMSGKRRWIQKMDSPAHNHGHSASPALAGDVVAVAINDDLFGLDVNTGRERWRVPSKQRWGTPIVSEVGNVPVFVTPNGEIVQAADGKVLWRDLGGLVFCSPVIVDRNLYFIQKRSVAYRLPDSIHAEPEELWTQKIKGDRHYASPLVHDGLIYAVSRGEYLTVIDAVTGEVIYGRELGLGGPGENSVYPSVTLAGQYVYIGCLSGTTIVLEPGRNYHEVARNSLEGFRSSPVFIGSRMYLRGVTHQYCISESKQAGLGIEHTTSEDSRLAAAR